MKNKRTALLHSVIALLLCIAMLTGTTFAWFTDEVKSGVNTIAAGNLDVDVYYGDPADENSIQNQTSLFNDVARWEPGAVAYENLTVANKGTLALKYQLSMNFGSENYIMEDGEATYGLSDILKIALVKGGVDKTLTREQLITSIPVSDWVAIDNFTLDGEVLANTNDETVGIVIWWAPSDQDNNWNVQNGKITSDGKKYLHIEFGVNLAATQYTYEEDSFNKNYDLYAAYPEVPSNWLTEGKTVNEGAITVIVPKGAPAGEYDIQVNKFEKTVNKQDHAKIDMDFTLTKDGAPVEPGSAVYTVIIAGDPMSEGHEITHNGEPVKKYRYDIFYNGIMFTTTSFSPFAVEYDVFGVDVDLDAETRTIQSGLFKELDSENPDRYNPLKIDPTLDSTEAESIAVQYDIDGVVHYAVSDRATTIFVGDADNGGATADTLNFLNGAANASRVKMINNNGLYKVFSDLKAVDHSTVYILPGIYMETTTVDVNSSTDIIGLGDTDEIQIIKVGAHTTKNKPSNRHLFNCANMDYYIQVTLRNLSLDASAKNSYMMKLGNNTYKRFADNAAVQAIRMSKVKCYDLIVFKDTADASSRAFYVNSDNPANDKKYYPAYMYVEHTTVNVLKDTYIADATGRGNSYFYYTGLTYSDSNTQYSKSSSYIQNRFMECSDWNW